MGRSHNQFNAAFQHVVRAFTPKSARSYARQARSVWNGAKRAYSGIKSFTRNPIVKAAGRSLYGGVKAAGRLAYRGLQNSQRIVGQDARRLYNFGRSLMPGKKGGGSSGSSPSPAPQPGKTRTRVYPWLKKRRVRHRF